MVNHFIIRQFRNVYSTNKPIPLGPTKYSFMDCIWHFVVLTCLQHYIHSSFICEINNIMVNQPFFHFKTYITEIPRRAWLCWLIPQEETSQTTIVKMFALIRILWERQITRHMLWSIIVFIAMEISKTSPFSSLERTSTTPRKYYCSFQDLYKYNNLSY